MPVGFDFGWGGARFVLFGEERRVSGPVIWNRKLVLFDSHICSSDKRDVIVRNWLVV